MPGTIDGQPIGHRWFTFTLCSIVLLLSSTITDAHKDSPRSLAMSPSLLNTSFALKQRYFNHTTCALTYHEHFAPLIIAETPDRTMTLLQRGLSFDSRSTFVRPITSTTVYDHMFEQGINPLSQHKLPLNGRRLMHSGNNPYRPLLPGWMVIPESIPPSSSTSPSNAITMDEQVEAVRSDGAELSDLPNIAMLAEGSITMGPSTSAINLTKRQGAFVPIQVEDSHFDTYRGRSTRVRSTSAINLAERQGAFVPTPADDTRFDSNRARPTRIPSKCLGSWSKGSTYPHNVYHVSSYRITSSPSSTESPATTSAARISERYGGIQYAHEGSPQSESRTVDGGGPPSHSTTETESKDGTSFYRGYYKDSSNQTIWFEGARSAVRTVPASVGSTECEYKFVTHTVPHTARIGSISTIMTHAVFCPMLVTTSFTSDDATRTTEFAHTSTSGLQHGAREYTEYYNNSADSTRWFRMAPEGILSLPTYVDITYSTKPSSIKFERRKSIQNGAETSRNHVTFDDMPKPLREFFTCLGDNGNHTWSCSNVTNQFRTWIATKTGHEFSQGYGMILGSLEKKPQPWLELLCQLDKYENQTYADATSPGNSSLSRKSSAELLSDSIKSFEAWLQTSRGFSEFDTYKKYMQQEINSGQISIYVPHSKGHEASSVVSACARTQSSSFATASASYFHEKRLLAARNSIFYSRDMFLPRNLLGASDKQIKRCKEDADKPVYVKRATRLIPNLLAQKLFMRSDKSSGYVPAAEAFLVSSDPLGSHCKRTATKENVMLLLVCLVLLILCLIGLVWWLLKRRGNHKGESQIPVSNSVSTRIKRTPTVRNPNTFNDITIPEEDVVPGPSNARTRPPWYVRYHIDPFADRWPDPKEGNSSSKEGKWYKRTKTNDPENAAPLIENGSPSKSKAKVPRETAIPLKSKSQPLAEKESNVTSAEAGLSRVVSTGMDYGESTMTHRRGSTERDRDE